MWLLLLMLLSIFHSKSFFDPKEISPISLSQKYIHAYAEKMALSRMEQIHYERGMLGRSVGHVSVSFLGSLPPSDAQVAIAYAATLMNAYFSPSATIVMAISWVDLSPVNVNLLGESSSTSLCLHPDSGSYPFMLIPSSLYVDLTSASNCPSIVVPYHGSITLNSHPPAPWYTGISGLVPGNTIDLVTVALHEMMHAMGFASYMEGNGVYGNAPYGFIFDWYLFANTSNGWPSSFSFAVSSVAITDLSVLTNHVSFSGTVTAGGISSFDVYTPSTFASGTSLSHVKPSSSIINRLMFPSIGHGQSWHNIGAYVWVAMKTMGYNMHPYVDLYNVTSITANGCTTCGAERVDWFVF